LVVLAVTLAVLGMGTVRGILAKQAPDRYPCAFEQRVNGRWTGKLSLDRANELRHDSVRIGQRIAVRLNDVTQADVPYMVDCIWGAYKLDAARARAVAKCESHFDPEAYNPGGYGGVFQHDLGAWPSRAAAYGHKGASPFDGYANLHVTAQMVRDQGWGGWGCG
jgi:hypothetical protein